MSVFKKQSMQALFAQYIRDIRPLDRDMILILEDLLINLGTCLVQGLDFVNNFNGVELTATAHASPDTEFAVAHDLDHVPSRFITTSIDEGGVVYKSSTAWTKTHVYLKCTTGGSNVVVFVY